VSVLLVTGPASRLLVRQGAVRRRRLGHLAAAVAATGVVDVDEPGDRPAGLVLGLEGAPRQQEGTLIQGVHPRV
jgi:hypothetical protein